MTNFKMLDHACLSRARWAQTAALAVLGLSLAACGANAPKTERGDQAAQADVAQSAVTRTAEVAEIARPVFDNWSERRLGPLAGGWSLTLRAPQQATVRQLGEAVEIKYAHPVLPSGVEITEGAFATVQIKPGVDFEAYAQTHATPGTIQPAQLAGRPALSYTTDAALGSGRVSHYVFAAGSTAAANVATVDVLVDVYGKFTDAYAGMLQRVVNSIELQPAEAE